MEVGRNSSTFRSSCYSPSFQPECEATGEVPPPTYTSSEEREDEEEVIEEGDEEEECSEGYVNSPSGECEDWDECSEGNGGCEESCMNKPGTYECTCPQVIQQQDCSTYPLSQGYDLSEDGHSCVDQDECLSNNGHGPCQVISFQSKLKDNFRTNYLQGC